MGVSEIESVGSGVLVAGGTRVAVGVGDPTETAATWVGVLLTAVAVGAAGIEMRKVGTADGVGVDSGIGVSDTGIVGSGVLLVVATGVGTLTIGVESSPESHPIAAVSVKAKPRIDATASRHCRETFMLVAQFQLSVRLIAIRTRLQ